MTYPGPFYIYIDHYAVLAILYNLFTTPLGGLHYTGAAGLDLITRTRGKT